MTTQMEMVMNDERFGKLPKWAQQEIKVLRMRWDEAEDQLKQFSGDKPTGFELTDYSRTFHLDPRFFRMRLHTDGIKNRNSGYLDARPKDKANMLEVSGSGPIQILPRASNVAWIMLTEEF